MPGLNTLKDEEGAGAAADRPTSRPKLQAQGAGRDPTLYNILSYAGRERAERARRSAFRQRS
mgnify:CR=1 FL=1